MGIMGVCNERSGQKIIPHNNRGRKKCREPHPGWVELPAVERDTEIEKREKGPANELEL